jgi:hypothetical protein
MTPTPPPGSRISVRSDNGDSVIVIPISARARWRYAAGVFLVFWLGGWLFGFLAAAKDLLSGKTAAQAQGGVILWLGAWTIAGIVVGYYVFRIFRPSIPESLRLKRNSLIYDPGIPPLQVSNRHGNQMEAWKLLFPKRTIVEVDHAQLASLRLRETESGNRLTVDANASRLDLASAGSEIDREWLYKLLAERYSLPATPSV